MRRVIERLDREIGVNQGFLANKRRILPLLSEAYGIVAETEEAIECEEV